MLSQRAGFHSFSWLKDSSVCVSVYIKYIFGVYVYLYLYIDREDAVCIYIYIYILYPIIHWQTLRSSTKMINVSLLSELISNTAFNMKQQKFHTQLQVIASLTLCHSQMRLLCSLLYYFLLLPSPVWLISYQLACDSSWININAKMMDDESIEDYCWELPLLISV